METYGRERRVRGTAMPGGIRSRIVPAKLLLAVFMLVLLPQMTRAFDPNLMDFPTFRGHHYDLKKVLLNFYETGAGKASGWTEEHQRGLDAFKREDYAAAVRIFTPLAEREDFHAPAFLSLIFREGLAEGGDAKKIKGFAIRSAQAGNPVSQYLLGDMVRMGYGTGAVSASSDQEAFGWFLAAARQGLAPAQARVADMFYSGKGVNRDPAEAFRWSRKAAEQGDAGAQNLLGILYYFGEAVERDPARAFAWYSQAAGQTILARFMLGYMHEAGEGTVQDYALAAVGYRKAVEGERIPHPPSAFNLGLLYENGRGVPQDFGEAARWYGKAADVEFDIAALWFGSGAVESVAKAQFCLSMLYYEGKGVNKDLARAAELAQKAAAWGYADAQWVLGIMYLNGEGVEKDSEAAERWFREAAAQGHTAAAEQLKIIEESLAVERQAALERAIGEADRFRARAGEEREKGLLRESLNHYRQAFDAYEKTGGKREKGLVLLDIANVLTDMKDEERALRELYRARDIFRETGGEQELAEVFSLMGYIDEVLGRWEDAIDALNAALETHLKLNDDARASSDRYNLGVALTSLKRYEEALEQYSLSREGWNRLGNREEEAFSLGGVGATMFSLGRFHEAADAYERARALWAVLGKKLEEAWSLDLLGKALEEDGRLEESVEAYEELESLWREFKTKEFEAGALEMQGKVLTRAGRFKEAHERIQRALDLLQREFEVLNEDHLALSVERNLRDQTRILIGFGELLAREGDLEGACGSYREAGETARRTGSPAEERKAMEGMAVVLARGGRLREAALVLREISDYDAAMQALEKALREEKVRDETGERARVLEEMGDVLRDRGRHRDAEARYRQALELEGAPGRTEAYARLMEKLGRTLTDLGLDADERKAADARRNLERSLELSLEAANPVLEASAHFGLGVLEGRLGRTEEAGGHLLKSRELRRLAGDAAGEAEAILALESLPGGGGTAGEAVARSGEALELARKAGDRLLQAKASASLAEAFLASGSPDKGIDAYSESLKIISVLRVLSPQNPMVADLEGEVGLRFATVLVKQSRDMNRALELFGSALAMKRKQGDRAAELEILENLAMGNYNMGRSRIALDRYRETLPILQGFGDKASEAETLRKMGDIYLTLREREPAVECYRQALTLLRDRGETRKEADLSLQISGLLVAAGRIAESMEYQQRYFELRAGGEATSKGIDDRVVPDDRVAARDWISLAGMMEGNGRFEAALEHYRKALDAYRGTGDQRGQIMTLIYLSRNLFALGRFEESLDRLESALALAQGTRMVDLEVQVLGTAGDVNAQMGRTAGRWSSTCVRGS